MTPQSPDPGGGDNGAEMEKSSALVSVVYVGLDWTAKNRDVPPVNLSHVSTREASCGRGQWRRC